MTKRLSVIAVSQLLELLYLDQGYAVAEKFILRNWHNFFKKSDITRIDPKTKLRNFH